MPTPDSGIKKVIVPKESLPAIFGSEHKYIVRYRIISEDKNRFSHWSQQYKITAPTISQINYSVVVEQDVNIIRLVWQQPINMSDFDIYVKWNNGDWELSGSASMNNYTTLIKSGATSFAFAVQAPTFPKQRFTNATLFETAVTAL